MKRLKKNVEERIEKTFREPLQNQEYVFNCSNERVDVVIFDVSCKYNRGMPDFRIVFVKGSLRIAHLYNYIYNHKELMEIINIIHNNLKNEENWEEVEDDRC